FVRMKLVKWGTGKRMIVAAFGPDGTAVWRGFVFDRNAEGEDLAMVSLANLPPAAQGGPDGMMPSPAPADQNGAMAGAQAARRGVNARERQKRIESLKQRAEKARQDKAKRLSEMESMFTMLKDPDPATRARGAVALADASQNIAVRSQV